MYTKTDVWQTPIPKETIRCPGKNPRDCFQAIWEKKLDKREKQWRRGKVKQVQPASIFNGTPNGNALRFVTVWQFLRLWQPTISKWKADPISPDNSLIPSKSNGKNTQPAALTAPFANTFTGASSIQWMNLQLCWYTKLPRIFSLHTSFKWQNLKTNKK